MTDHATRAECRLVKIFPSNDDIMDLAEQYFKNYKAKRKCDWAIFVGGGHSDL